MLAEENDTSEKDSTADENAPLNCPRSLSPNEAEEATTDSDGANDSCYVSPGAYSYAMTHGGFRGASSSNGQSLKRNIMDWMREQVLGPEAASAIATGNASKRCKMSKPENSTDEESPLQDVVNSNGTTETAVAAAEETLEQLHNSSDLPNIQNDLGSGDAGPDKRGAQVENNAESRGTDNATETVSSADLPSCSTGTIAEVRIKTEPEDPEDSSKPQASSSGTSNFADIKPAIKVEKADASSTTREMCKFGVSCYRRNPMHRMEQAHPGDSDYKRPNYPPPPKGTPDCPFGNSCYRRNPVHFQQFYHPPDTDFEQNYKKHCMRLRQRRQQLNSSNDSTGANVSGHSSDLDDYDLEDPFIDDGDSEYVPSNDELDDDEADYDDCDKAEE